MSILMVKKSEPIQAFIGGKVDSITFTLLEISESVRQSGEYDLVHADSVIVGLGPGGSFMGLGSYPTTENDRRVDTHISSSYIRKEHLSAAPSPVEDEQGNPTYNLTLEELGMACFASIKEWWGDTFGTEVGNHPAISAGGQFECRLITVPAVGDDDFCSFGFFLVILTDPEQFKELVGLSYNLHSTDVNLHELIAAILRDFDNPKAVAEIMAAYLHTRKMSQSDLSHMVALISMLVKPIVSVFTGEDIEAALDSVVKRILAGSAVTDEAQE